MKLTKMLLCAQALICIMLFNGCARSGDAVWDDTRTAGRYVGCGFRSLGGKNGHSRQVCSPQEFGPCYTDVDLCALTGQDEYYAVADVNYPQASELPGDPGSSIPGVEAFSDPSLHPHLSGVFQHVHFSYDSPLVKGEENQRVLDNVADYMHHHSNTYLFIEGHADERGPDAYNLALGAQRANTVRNLLIDKGISPDHLFTISYGKERPLVMEHHEDAWSQNRRAEFKVYQR